MKSGGGTGSRERKSREQLMGKENNYQEVLKCLVQNVRKLPEVLFLLEAGNDEVSEMQYHSCKRLLPPAMLRIWNAYEGGYSCGTSDDGYELILEGALQSANSKQLLRLVESGKDFRSEVLRQFAQRLMKEEQWQAAFAVLTMIPAEDICTDEEFWYNAGRCLFQLGEFEGAETCLVKSLKLREDYPPARAFLKWTREMGRECGSQHA